MVFSQFDDYCHHSEIFYDSQYGFLEKYSTEYAAIEIDKMLKGTDETKISLAILMDLSKAFNNSDHVILIKKLH